MNLAATKYYWDRVDRIGIGKRIACLHHILTRGFFYWITMIATVNCLEHTFEMLSHPA